MIINMCRIKINKKNKNIVQGRIKLNQNLFYILMRAKISENKAETQTISTALIKI